MACSDSFRHKDLPKARSAPDKTAIRRMLNSEWRMMNEDAKEDAPDCGNGQAD